MGFINNIFSSLTKSHKLQQMQNDLGNIPIPQDATSLMSWSEKREKLLNQYIDFCLTDLGVLKIVKDFEITKKDLKEIYNKLLSSGAGQWVRGHYVALSTLAYMQPLEYFLKAKRMHKSDIEIMSNLIVYFEKRMVSIPNEWL